MSYPYMGSLFSLPNGQGKYLGADVNQGARNLAYDIVNGTLGPNVVEPSALAVLQNDSNIPQSVVAQAQSINNQLLGVYNNNSSNQALVNQIYESLFPSNAPVVTPAPPAVVTPAPPAVVTPAPPAGPGPASSSNGWLYLLMLGGAAVGLIGLAAFELKNKNKIAAKTVIFQ